MEYFDISVLLAVTVVVVSIAVRFLRIPLSKKRPDVVEQTKYANISSLQTIQEEDEEHIQEVSRCALLLANYDPNKEEKRESAQLTKSWRDGLENLLLKPDELDADGGDSLMVNVPENIAEEQEADFIDLTADDISVAEDTEPDNELSPQDMADIANELDTSMTGMNSQEDEVSEGLNELVISENDSLFKDIYDPYDVEDRPKIIEIGDDENDQCFDRLNIHDRRNHLQGKTGSVLETYLDQDGSPMLMSQTVESSTAHENIAMNEDATSIITAQGQSDREETGPNNSPSSSETLFKEKFKEISYGLTEEELEAEKRAQGAQLNNLLQMMKGNPEMIGALTDEEIDNQIKMYFL